MIMWKKNLLEIDRSLARRYPMSGFSFVELVIVVAGICIILGLALPILGTVTDQYRLVLSAQTIVSRMQFARMKAVSSNESFQVNFPAGQAFCQVEDSGGNIVAGPFQLQGGITWNAIDAGSDVSFSGRILVFLPNGAVAPGGSGRAKIINNSGNRIDIVVDSGGVIRETPTYSSPPAPF